MQSASKTLNLLDSTIGKKAALAVSGVVLFGFAIGHMVGNLQVYLGPEVFNGYAATLRDLPALVWGTRVLLLVSVVVHVAMMIALYDRSLSARPVAYHKKQNIAVTYASATMRYTGPLLLLYILFHLAHFTWPGVAMGDYEHSKVDVYANFVNGFSVPWVSAIYLAANLFLGMHLFHGAWSLFQTLGLNHPRYNALRKRVAVGLAAFVTLGNLSFPLAVLFGFIQ